jgi:hypothetical protein
MNPVDDMPMGVDERTERLICRRLDGEIAPTEQAELDEALARNPAARRLLDDYRQIDLRAADALRSDFHGATTATAPRRRSGLWLATAGGLLAAAAVVALSLLPDLWSSRRTPDQISQNQLVNGPSHHAAAPGEIPQPLATRNGLAPAAPQFADYRNVEQGPVRRLRDVQRDLIGIPSADMKTIFIIERKTQTTKLTPISGDF